MYSIRDRLANAPAAGVIARAAGRGSEQVAYLLESGIAVAAPRCAACATAFDSPRRAGERFRVALRVYDALGGADSVPSTRMFVGKKVLVARAAAALGATLDESITFVGARVMVASVHAAAGGRALILLCRGCGENIAAHLGVANRHRYAWDWLVDFSPRKWLARLGAQVLMRRAAPVLAMRGALQLTGAQLRSNQDGGGVP
jgi:hypothetical protein